jgi:predicted GNAT family N-acyltransferase
MAQLSLIEVQDPPALESVFMIRRRVFVDEQGVGEELEIDAHEAEARHLLALCDGEPVGTLRLRLVGDQRTAKIERVAVLAEARGAGVGEALMRRALDVAETAGARSAVLHAQVQAQNFYHRFGFEPEGAPFIEDGLPHVVMARPLAGAAAPTR